MKSVPSTCLLIGVVSMWSGSPADAQVATGSQMPCAVPMSWTVASVDGRFDLSEAQAMQAIRDAGDLWEQAVGRGLFRYDDPDGWPVYFDFDERQANIAEGQERQRALDAERSAIESQGRGLERSAAEHEDNVRSYELDAAEHGRAVRAYNNDMSRASRQNEVSSAERRELQRRGDELERSGRDLERRVRELNQNAAAIGDDSDRLNEWIAQFSERQASHVDAYPASPTQAGRYDETLFWQDAVPDSITRRIRIFQFSDYDGLVLTLAHELGHALGLGHAPGEGALMSAVLSSGITATDRDMLLTICQDLSQDLGTSSPF